MEKRTYPPRSRRTARRILAENLRLVRFHRGIPQEELADIVGLDRTYLGCVERAQRNICIDNIEKIATALGVSVPHLLTEPDTRELPTLVLEEIRKHIREEPAVYLPSQVALARDRAAT